jgi:hypothetical protein
VGCAFRDRLCIALSAATFAYTRVYHQSPLSSSSSSSVIPVREWREEQPTTNQQHMIPVIGEAKFNEYYGLKYKGQLSSVISKWESPDEDVVSCGTNPDFFDFFKLSQSQRQVRIIYWMCLYISILICINSLFNRFFDSHTRL